MNDQKWTIAHSKDVQDWYKGLNSAHKARADQAFDRLQQQGPQIREPHSKSLNGGLYELRFRAQNVNTRVTYHRNGNEFRTLTVFRKQRQNERTEVEKARLRMKSDRAILDRAGKEQGGSGQQRGQGGRQAQQSRQSQQGRSQSPQTKAQRKQARRDRGR
ncbi:MAG: type II toxin-antitoxin system RelE/ParE family toxin [Streptosporangiales bacterium]|nr:type II toxin-antitoxin system RelE/ParE family toxin [Streptosporangiales bacterium]